MQQCNHRDCLSYMAQSLQNIHLSFLQIQQICTIFVLPLRSDLFDCTEIDDLTSNLTGGVEIYSHSNLPESAFS